MAKPDVNTPKGFRDFLPPAAAGRAYLLEKIKPVLERYGFEPLETPAIEYAETLKGKYGEEEKLIYEFEDRGGRQLALRYDQTVPLARVIAQYPDLPRPFKRYQIQPVWRAENPQRGRFREFLQVDFDTVGAESLLADAEVITAAVSCLKDIGFKNFTVKINDRAVFKDLPSTAISSIDKIKKIGEDGVLVELQNKGFKIGEARKILDQVKNNTTTDAINELFLYLDQLGVPKENYAFDPSLARGLDYYTGSIFEIEVDGFSAGSIGGGGRYDDLIGIFSKDNIPAVGFSFGFDRLIEAAKEQKLIPEVSSKTKVLMTVFDENLTKESLLLTSLLRNSGVNAECYLEKDVKLEKQIKYADSKGIPFLAIVGPEELEKSVVTLKDLTSGKQEQLKQTDLIKKLQ